MNESYKTNLVRSNDFASLYLRGTVIDIGAGKDTVCTWAEAFDIQHGDANDILKFLGQHSYDTVYSSHCLEHMHNPRSAIAEWWKLVKPGGFLIIVVPEENLYEQGIWPSRFNSDHKFTFRSDSKKSWSPVSINIVELIEKLPNSHIINYEIQSTHYNHSLNFISRKDPRPFPKFLRPLRAIELLITKGKTSLFSKIAFHYFNTPIDQTLGPALAQIQIICKKISP